MKPSLARGAVMLMIQGWVVWLVTNADQMEALRSSDHIGFKIDQAGCLHTLRFSFFWVIVTV
jgi:hypothetical protein